MKPARRPWRLATSLSLSFTLLFVITFAAVSFVTFYAANHAYDVSMDRDLEGLAQTADQRLQDGSDTPQAIVGDLSSAVFYVELRSPAGVTEYRSSNLGTARLPVRTSPIPAGDVIFRTGRLNKSALRLIVYPLVRNDAVTGYVVAGSVAPEFDDLLRELVPAESLAGLAGLAIAVGGTLYLSDRSTRPLTELAARVNGAATQGFTEELDPPPGGSAEAQQLGEAFHELIHRQRQEMQRERAFFADSSHVLRTPLAVASGNVELLEQGVSEEERAQVVAQLRASLDSMARTVSGLLLLAREQEQPGATWEAIALSEQLPALAREAAAASPELRFAVDVPEGLELAGDRHQLRDLFSTVIENSCRYTPAGGEVRIAARPDGAGNVVVEVSDTGIGITPEEGERALERFFRGARARKLAPGGAGLGLSIAERIVLLHHGTLSIEPRDPAGTTVRITLPLLA